MPGIYQTCAALTALCFFFSLLSVTLDLSDEDGEIKNLHEFPTQYAHRFLKGREVLVLIKVESKSTAES